MIFNTKENPKILNDFLMFLYTVRGYSKNTITTYNFNILHFLKFLLQCWEMPITTKDITIFILINVKEKDIVEYLSYLNYSLNNSPKTRQSKIDAIRSFYKWLFNTFPICSNRKNPVEVLPKVQQNFRLPKYLSLENARKIQNIFNISNSRNHIRDNLIITMFLSTGIRLSELVNININEIDFKNKSLKIIGKGEKERVIFFNDACLCKIKNYLNIRFKNTNIVKIDEPLFINKNGQRLMQHGVENICKKAFKLAGLEDYNYTTHSLRHTVATHIYSRTEDIVALKTLLGHSNISSTEIYTQVYNSKVKEAVNKNPLNTIFSENIEEGRGEAV